MAVRVFKVSYFEKVRKKHAIFLALSVDSIASVTIELTNLSLIRLAWCCFFMAFTVYQIMTNFKKR